MKALHRITFFTLLAFGIAALALVLAPVTPVAAQSPCGDTYTVRLGDTLRGIAGRCNTTVSEILALNPGITNPNLIYAGQVIDIPQPGEEPGDQPGQRVYIVQPGDWLWNIARRFDLTLSELLAANPGIQTPNTIQPGRRLVIPARPGQPDDGNLFTHVLIYLIKVGDAGESGPEIGCDDSVIPVEIEVEPTIAPLTAALEYMLEIDSTTHDLTGLYNALGNSDLEVAGISAANGSWTVALTGDLQLGGVCDNPRVEEQLRRTALQFSTVDEVTFTINGTPLDEVLSLQ